MYVVMIEFKDNRPSVTFDGVGDVRFEERFLLIELDESKVFYACDEISRFGIKLIEKVGDKR